MFITLIESDDYLSIVFLNNQLEYLYEKKIINMPSKYNSSRPFFWSARFKFNQNNGDLYYFDEYKSNLKILNLD